MVFSENLGDVYFEPNRFSQGSWIWDGEQPHLIDWAFARFANPAHDVAHILFWLIEGGLWDAAFKEYRRAKSRYRSLGFSFDVLPFYLGQRYIEFGRIQGREYIEQGLEIIGTYTSGSFEKLFERKFR